MDNQFLILGIDETTGEASIMEAFQYLRRHLDPDNFPAGSASQEQARRCIARVKDAYADVCDEEGRAKYRQQLMNKPRLLSGEDMKPYLGHLCVAAGIISLEDLMESIDKQADIDLPLGQILQEQQLLSQTELDGLLMGQRLFESSPQALDETTSRLIALNAVSRDMVRIVMIDQRTAYSSLPDLLVKRGWLSDAILQILSGQNSRRKSPDGD